MSSAALRKMKLCTVVLLMLMAIGRSSEAAVGSVVVVDGMNPETIVMNDQSPTDYLYSSMIAADKYRQIRDRIGPAQPFYWGNNPILDTNFPWSSVQSLYEILKPISDQNKLTNAPLIILAHSWGTVITYITLKKHPDIVVDKLITMGSPLEAQSYPVWWLTYTSLMSNGVFL